MSARSVLREWDVRCAAIKYIAARILGLLASIHSTSTACMWYTCCAPAASRSRARQTTGNAMPQLRRCDLHAHGSAGSGSIALSCCRAAPLAKHAPPLRCHRTRARTPTPPRPPAGLCDCVQSAAAASVRERALATAAHPPAPAVTPLILVVTPRAATSCWHAPPCYIRLECTPASVTVKIGSGSAHVLQTLKNAFVVIAGHWATRHSTIGRTTLASSDTSTAQGPRSVASQRRMRRRAPIATPSAAPCASKLAAAPNSIPKAAIRATN